MFSDYRLNPVLRKACKADIPKFCQSVLNKASDANELEGQVISCLKLKYADQVCVSLNISNKYVRDNVQSAQYYSKIIVLYHTEGVYVAIMTI